MNNSGGLPVGWFLLGCCAVLTAGCGNDVQGNAGSAPAGGHDATVGVLLETARAESFPYEIEALGTANANEAVSITAKVSNLITAIHFEEGQQVRRGQVLVELDGAQAKADLAAARAELSDSRSQFRRAEELRATQALSQSELERLEAMLLGNEARVQAAEARVADTVIRAPFDGRVGLRRVSVGSLISPGTVITTLDDTRTIKLDFSVPENFISVLREGMSIVAGSAAWPQRQFNGEVASIDSRVDPVTRSVIVRALVPNPEDMLKPGMFLTLKLRQPRDEVVMISEEALVPEEGRQFVFVVEEATAHRREVQLGRRKPGEVEILSGLAAGERIVVEGTQRISDGARVREITT
jgi:membrane fusion protein (multidrug efflux system)